VHAVLTHEDAPSMLISTARHEMDWMDPEDTRVLDDVVRFIGQRVAAIVAESETAAEEACRRLKLDYEILPALIDPEQAMAPGARITAHRDSVAPLLQSLTLLQVVAFGRVLLLSAAAAAAVVLAARGSLDTHRFTIEVMHGIGATDMQVTHLFQRKIAIDAFIGSVAGGLAAAVVLLLLAGGAAFARDLTGGATLGLRDILILTLLPLALTALATWVARAAVLAALREAL